MSQQNNPLDPNAATDPNAGNAPAPLGLGKTIVAEYNVEGMTFRTDHVVVALERAATGLNPGDRGYVGVPKQIRFGVGDPSEASEFQPGKRVRVTIEVL